MLEITATRLEKIIAFIAASRDVSGRTAST
jgi:hypothetical protein